MLNVPSEPGDVSTWLPSLVVVEKMMVPRNRPGLPATAFRVYSLPFGKRTCPPAAATGTESVSVTTWTCTLGSAAVQTPPAPHCALVVHAPASGTVLPAPMVRHFAS